MRRTRPLMIAVFMVFVIPRSSREAMKGVPPHPLYISVFPLQSILRARNVSPATCWTNGFNNSAGLCSLGMILPGRAADKYKLLGSPTNLASLTHGVSCFFPGEEGAGFIDDLMSIEYKP